MDLTRRDFVVLSGAAAGSALLPPPALPRVTAAVVPFPFGTHVYREPPLSLEQLASDLPLLKRLGFSMIKIQESWSTDERKPGEIDLSHVENVVSRAKQSRLLVYFGVTMEQAPAWLWRQFPDATMLYEDGSPHNDPTQYLLPGDGKPGPCWHHPDARAAAERFIEAVGRRIGRYDNIAVWNVWQEIGLAPWNSRPNHRYLCYCVHSLAAFRGWLRERYGSLEKLNENWRTAFGTWDEVEPPRLFTPLPSMLDWRIFMEDEYLAGVLDWKAQAFRRSDPGKRPVMAHTGGPTYGSTADWAYARKLEVYGSSFYPGWGEPEDIDVSSAERVKASARPYDQLWGNVMLRMDYLRSSSQLGNVWAAELQGGRAGGGPTPGRTPDPMDIRRWVLGVLACGARGICFWNHRNEPMWSETSGFGLLDREGDSTSRAEEAGRLGRAIQTQAELFSQGSVPNADVAIVVTERGFQFASASEPAFIRTQTIASVRGMYKALWAGGIQADFVDSDALLSKPAGYKVLILPAPLLLSAALVPRLVAYVQAGGTLISEATPGRFDDYGFGEPQEMAPELAKLFGVEHARLAAWQTDDSANTGFKVTPQPWQLTGTGLLSTHRGSGNVYLQVLKLAGGEAILTHGDYVVGSSNAAGKGRAVLLGSWLGSAMADVSDSGNEGIIQQLVADAGVKSDRVGELLRRRRVFGATQAWFLINPTRATLRETVRGPNGASVADLLAGTAKSHSSQITVEVGPLDIACVIVR